MIDHTSLVSEGQDDRTGEVEGEGPGLRFRIVDAA